MIDPPSVPGAPASPNRPLLLVGVLIVGIGAGVGAAFAMGQVRNTFPTAQKLAKAAGPAGDRIGDGNAQSGAQLLERQQRMKLFAGGCAGLGGVCLLLIVVEFIQRGMAWGE